MTFLNSTNEMNIYSSFHEKTNYNLYIEKQFIFPMRKVGFSFILFLLFCSIDTKATTGADTLKANSLLYTGVEYTTGLILLNESPFFPKDEFFVGNLRYQGNLYKGIEMKYDCKDDLLLIKDQSGDSFFQLIKEKLEEFNLGEHHFVKLKIQSVKGEFYEQVYSGKRDLVVQWQKKIVRNQSEEKRYELFKNIYLLNGKDTVRINKISELIDLTGNNKKKLERFYKEKHLRFRRDPVNAVVTILKKAESEGW